MMTKYNIEFNDNYNDCGTMLYDLDRQPVLAEHQDQLACH